MFRIITFFFVILVSTQLIYGQEVPIVGYSVNDLGQVQLEINSTPDLYYILKVKTTEDSNERIPVSMTLGKTGTTIVSEVLEAYPQAYYQVLAYPINTPFDTDGDGIDDMTEYQNIPVDNPFNAAASIDEEDGLMAIDSFSNFTKLSVTKDVVQYSEFLNGKVFVKFMISDFDSDQPKVYFINSERYELHGDFADALGIEFLGDQIKRGQIIFHPTTIANNGNLGTFVFNYSNGLGKDFEVVQRTHELLAANMFFLENNLSYLITELSEDEYERDTDLYEESRVPIVLEEDLYGGIDYWGLNKAEGYGFLRTVSSDEIPGTRDLVIYDILPNNLPRVGGIITSVIQTPLSHVNLRAIQNNIPNAFIKDPLAIDSIANLLNSYVYFKVEQDAYVIREASIEEVNDWFEDLRSPEIQEPPLNLDYQDILPLSEITFDMFDGFGAKCTNIATMRTFGFPEGTIPNGFGIPFYYYQEFMKHNQFFDEIRTIMETPNFEIDRELRSDLLKDFRKKIKDATLPDWMVTELSTLQAAFPEGISIRCRSSTNNEDLPGFNGAGLYDSKTQHPDEGHISKSVKQVYASLWNLRAFEERDFYRINQFNTSMGILCHPNYQEEKANGVGVSIDPVFNIDHHFYLNSQVGEELVTNPGAAAVPEEILLDRFFNSETGFIVVQRSNFIPSDTLIMGPIYLDQMRDYLSVIHDEFAILYDAVGKENFAMDIEYKITSEDQLIIKQARPWVSYVLEEATTGGGTDEDDSGLNIFPNPARASISVACPDCQVSKIRIVDALGRLVSEELVVDSEVSTNEISINRLPIGIYLISVFSEDQNEWITQKIMKY